ncbi:MAG: hypothetical protein JKY54_01010, partial [Flavobacteriales bacterium]|nr:hypothetical protein [Flavobacteriales bacterium]
MVVLMAEWGKSMFKFCCFLFLILFFFENQGISQTRVQVLGSSSGNEGASSIAKHLISGDYFIGGYKDDSALVVRTTGSGDVVWSRTIDAGPDPDYILCIQITSDNYVLLGGNARTSSSHNDYGFIVKMDLLGNIVWSRKYNAFGAYMWSQSVIEVTNGNYRVTGSYNDNKQECFQIEFDESTGNVLWDSIYAQSPFGNARDEAFNEVMEHPLNSSTYAAGRFEKGGGFGSYRPSLTKFNPNGSLDWSKTYLYGSGTSGGRLYTYSADHDADSIVCGLIGVIGGSSPPFSAGIFKTDMSGNISWAKEFDGGSLDLRSYNTVVTPLGYVLTGWVASGNKDLFMIKTDKQGNVIWSRTYGALGSDDVYLFSSN